MKWTFQKFEKILHSVISRRVMKITRIVRDMTEQKNQLIEMSNKGCPKIDERSSFGKKHRFSIKDCDVLIFS